MDPAITIQELESANRRLEEDNRRLLADLEEFRERLHEPEELIRAVRCGEVDAFVVTESTDEKIYALRRADRLYRLMIERMREGAVALAPDGTILYCNRHFAKLVGSNPEDLVSRPFDRLIAPAHRDEFKQSLAKLQCSGGNGFGGDGRGEIELRTRSGQSVPVSFAASRLAQLADDTDVLGLVLTDLRPYRHREELLQADRRKNEFLAMLAHELRNPMMPIRNALDLLERDAVDPQTAAEARRIMQQQIEHLVRLVDDLLDVSRIIWGKIELRVKPLELSAIIDQAVETVRPAVTRHRHALTVVPPPDAVWVEGDFVRLVQVVSNLLTNAAKYTPPGGNIRVALECQDDWAVIRVTDDGRGIDPSLLPHVFDLFTQADSSMERSEGGLGIGLTLVRTLVELHGGGVSAHSEGLGRGSAFVVRLPTLSAAPVEAAPQQPAAIDRAFRILVVEDNVTAAQMLTMLLGSLGSHEIRSVHDGPAALEAFEEFHPEIVLLDVGLPGLNGYEVARKLRERPGGDAPLVVALTGYSQEEDVQQALQAGCDRHLVKPPSLETLLEVLRAAHNTSAQ